MKKIISFLVFIFALALNFNFAQAVAQIDEGALSGDQTAIDNSPSLEDITVDDSNMPSYTEEINNFNSEIKINKDSSIDVKEIIVYNFGSLQKHGIYRDIPYKYNARGGNFKLRFSNIKVTDEKGNGYTYTTSKSGGKIKIKIGDADQYVTGVHTYVISYKVERALNYFKDHDELYWNVTGNDWLVPIKISQSKVILPESITENNIQVKCFTGTYGSTTSNCTASAINDNTVYYETNSDLYSYEGLTIVLGWPKNITTKPALSQIILWTLSDNWYLGLPFLVLILSYLYWRVRGKDPKGRGTIIAEYEAPDNLTPAEIGTVYDNRADNKDVTATLIQLAINGYLKIKQTSKSKSDYKFIKLKENVDLKNEFEKKLLDSIFDSGNEKELKDMKNKFFKDMQDIKSKIYNSVTTKGYYSKNPSRARFGLLFVLSMFAIFGSFIIGSMLVNFYLGVSVFISGVIMLVFAMFMPQKTVKGAETLEKIQGFKQFMMVTEKERLKFHNPPDMIPGLFEKYLPYAMALGVENKWAENFKDIYNQAPEWYEGYSTTGTWSAIALTNSLSSFSTSSQTTMVSSPSSASSGGSGFSGGGSGGGGGGGGGGSW